MHQKVRAIRHYVVVVATNTGEWKQQGYYPAIRGLGEQKRMEVTCPLHSA
jgi:hypothetical protein